MSLVLLVEESEVPKETSVPTVFPPPLPPLRGPRDGFGNPNRPNPLTYQLDTNRKILVLLQIYPTSISGPLAGNNGNVFRDPM